jgi:hypothetical protein
VWWNPTTWDAKTWQNVGAVAAGLVAAAAIIGSVVAVSGCVVATLGVCGVILIGAAVVAGGVSAGVTYGLQSGKKSAAGLSNAIGDGMIGGLVGAGIGAVAVPVIGGVIDAIAPKVSAFVGGMLSDGGSAMGANSAAGQAARLQGSGDYPGVDNWGNSMLHAGDIVHAGEPGITGFATSDEAASAVGNDAVALNEGLQIASRSGSYRPNPAAFRITQDTQAARSTALANPQYGAGGLEQYYIPNLEDVATRVGTRLMN